MRQPSTPCEASPATSDSKTDLRERMRMIGKLFSMYPLAGNQEPKAAQVAYLEETSTIPTRILMHALGRLTRQADRRFVPSVGEIRATAARIIQAHLPRPPQGMHAIGYNPNADGSMSEIDIQRWLDKAHLVALPSGSGRVVAIAERASQRMGVNR